MSASLPPRQRKHGARHVQLDHDLRMLAPEAREDVREDVLGDGVGCGDANGTCGAAVMPGEPALEPADLRTPLLGQGADLGSGLARPDSIGRALEQGEARALLDPILSYHVRPVAGTDPAERVGGPLLHGIVLIFWVDLGCPTSVVTHLSQYLRLILPPPRT